ncbi:MAG: matrixin family metalloprotease [Balneolaceae bacterium]|nr:matrixin family metalloprotease [Balneolaceae bacterium]
MHYLFIIFIGLFAWSGLFFADPSAAGINSSPNDSTSSDCSEPITWRIGSIDQRFDLNKDDLRRIMKDVRNLWSDAANRTLIQYSDSGEVAINLIYSENQKFTENEQQLSGQIKKMRHNYFSMRTKYQRRSVEFQRQLKSYNQIFSEYAEIVNEYNLRLSRLTNSGIVSRNDDEKLKNLKKQMEFLEKKLNPLEEKLNTEEGKLNQLSEKLNAYADEVNEFIYQYRNRFGQVRTFHQGIYINVGNQKKINIYQFENLNKLRLVLAHEFGHALGLNHTDNPASIMNYNMQFQLDESLKLSDDDRDAIQNRCHPLIE